jgi:flagellar M-ring protein FliF
MNNSIAQLARQLATIWKHLGVNQRVSLVLAVGLVLAGVLGLVVWSTRADYALLYGKLPETESAKVIAALDDAKVPYRISSGGGSILVPADKVHVVRMQLASKGIPRGDGVGFEIFDKPNFGISDFIQRANYLRAIQGELARTIAQVDNVDSARVMVVIPENRLLVDQQKKPTASVFVKVKGNAQLPAQTVNAIRFLVANAVEGLQANFVTVVDNLGNVLSENTESDSLVGLTTTQLAARKNLEQYLAKKAEGMLETVLGPGQAVVRVAAEINFDTTTRVEEKFDPEGQVLRSATIDDENTDSTLPSSGGAPGVAANANTETNALAAAVSPPSNRTKKKLTTNQYEINRSTSNLSQAAGGVKRLSAAVFIAAKTEGSGATRKALTRTKEELDRLRHIVQSALGIQEGDATRQDQITLEEMPFNDQPAIEVAQQLEKQSTREFWWSLAGKGIYPLLALGILGFFWRVFKRTPSEGLPMGGSLGSLEDNGQLGGGAHRPGHAKRPPAVTVEVLNQLIRESPTNMTQAIRSWMTRENTN